MPTIAIYAIGAIALLVTGFVSGYRVEAWHCASEQKAAIEESISQYKTEAEKANAAAQALERQLGNQNAQSKSIAEAVARIASRPAYRTQCLDADGLRAANAALTGQTSDPSGPHGSVSGSRPAAKRHGS